MLWIDEGGMGDLYEHVWVGVDGGILFVGGKDVRPDGGIF